jgi:L-rhamnose-H+ transport protein
MNISVALLLIIIAGFINGSFALPTKYATKWKFENIWFNFALFAFVILPWITALILIPKIFTVYAEAPAYIFWIMLIGGFVFGIGQMFFALAMNMIGIGLGFVINLGLGIILGFSLPLIFKHPDQILTPFGLFTLLGSLLAVTGLIFSSKAGNMRNREFQEMRSPEEHNPKLHTIGVILAILAGLSSAGQNFAFALTAPMQQLALQNGVTPFGAASIMWPGFLTCGFIPYALYMLYLNHKNNSYSHYFQSGTSKYYLYAVVMGLFWFGSLMFYSKATQLIGSLGPIVGWPLFMVLIVLVSNFWGWYHKEWAGCTAKTKHVMWGGLGFLILAMVVLGYGSIFHVS